MKERVLVICTHNATRSQMAEGLINSLFSKGYVASSAGSHPSRVHPLAVRAMAELGFDISRNRSKHLDEFRGREFDHVIMVCDGGRCPAFFGGRRYISHPFPDPSMVGGTEEERLEAFRTVRNEILAWLEEFLGAEQKAEVD